MVSSKFFITTAALVAAVAAVPFPEAVAQLPGATLSCHSYCGNLIIESRKCTGTECCAEGTPFMDLVPDCLECGWQLWSYYGKYLVGPLGTCGLPTEPTGANPNAEPTSAPAEQPTTAAAEPEPTKAPEESKPAEPAQTEQPKPEEPAQTEQPKTEESKPEEPKSEQPKSEAPAQTEAPKTEAHSSHASSASSAPAPVVTSAAKSSSVKFGNSTTVTETICTKSACQNPKPTQSTIEQVNGATQYTVAGAIAVVAGVAALF